MRMHEGFVVRLSLVLILGVVFTGLTGSWAQTTQAQGTSRGGQSESAKSRAELAAEQQVALSPEKIIELLRQEPGLLLQVKKMLVRKAYEQGRILDPEDLTDDALFELLQEDHNICVLATHEIEDRAYIRAKPTLEEVERRRELDARVGLARTAGTEAQKQENARTSASREDAYWKRHDEDDLEQYAVPLQQWRPNQTQPNTPLNPRQNPVIENSQRQVEMTSLPQDQDSYDIGADSDGRTRDSGMMTRIGPEQLSGLINASSSSSLNTAKLDGAVAMRGCSDYAQMRSYSGSLSAGTPGSGSMGTPQGNGGDFSGRSSDGELQAKLSSPHRQAPSLEDLNLDRPQIRQRANPYANVPSLYDLYSQVSPRPAMLEHFGTQIFRNGTGNIDRLPMDLPVGMDYVLGPGDGVSIDVWGGVAQRLQRVVDRSGRLALPEVGTVDVSGRTLGDVQRIVQAALRTQFHEVEADVSLARIRSVRVYVVGEVENPGAYDISSLSTPLNALYAAGGPTSRGSLRHLRLYRGKELMQEVDAYDLLLHGVHNSIARIQSGDTLQVPAMGAEVTVEGMVMHPAVYERVCACGFVVRGSKRNWHVLFYSASFFYAEIIAPWFLL
jgi:protein involved in polysaccharide export with SLBB domain